MMRDMASQSEQKGWAMRYLDMLAIVVLVGAGSNGYGAIQAPAADHKPDRIVIEHHTKSLTCDIIIQADKGCVSWSDMLIGLARARGYDDAAFADLLPADKSLRLNHWSSGLAVLGCNKILPRGIRLTLLSPLVGEQEPRLKITLDRKILLASQRQFQKKFRAAVLQAIGPQYPGISKDYGLKLDKDWDKLPLQKPLVVLVHGFQASLKFNDVLAGYLRQQGFAVGDFRYPNDQSLDDSAELLAKNLKNIVVQQPGRKVHCIGHSMGGLVVRRVIEDAELDPGNVVRLIMVCTPNQGSKLACFGFGLELWEHLVDNPQDHVLKTFFASVEDGLGEAAEDLDPDSVFLQQLNSKPRNAKVQYTLLLGSKGVMSQAALDQLRKQAPQLKALNRWIKFFGPKLDGLLADLDEVVAGKGDGTVAVSRCKLAGVTDCVILEFDHLAIAREPQTKAEHQLRAEILKRLQGK
jgi:pimeloyl-ACP methyl ester carboxylesterase